MEAITTSPCFFRISGILVVHARNKMESGIYESHVTLSEVKAAMDCEVTSGILHSVKTGAVDDVIISNFVWQPCQLEDSKGKKVL